MRMQSAMRGEERWMDVEEPPLPAADKGGIENAHVAGERNELGSAPLDRLRDQAAMGAAVHAARFDDGGRQPEPARGGEARGVRSVTHHRSDPPVDAAVASRLLEREHVAATSRDQHREWQGHQAICTPAPATTSPMRLARSPPARSISSAASASERAITAIMPM